ncbi:MAG: hypothetical protein ACR2QE_16755 [Acidimicrobiales bacterium]
MSDTPHITFVCTGNAARSVMARAMFAHRAGDSFSTSGAGTLVVDGLPMSQRTRNALGNFGLADPGHRSRQLDQEHIERSDLLVVMEPAHVQWMRRKHPDGADRTGTIKRLVRDLPATDGLLHERVQALSLATVEIEAWEEVIDPAAGEQPDFDACAAQLDQLVEELVTIMLAGRRAA